MDGLVEKLYQAIKNSNTTEILELLDDRDIQKTINVNVNQESNHTFLSSACIYGNVEVVQKLLAIPNIDLEKGNALLCATSHNRSSIVDLLLEAGAKRSRLQADDCIKPVECAALLGYTETLKVFLDRYPKLVNVRIYNKNYTLVPSSKGEAGRPIHYAALGGNIKAVEILVERGADLFINGYGQTPYDIAVEHKHDKVAEYLKSKMETIKLKDTAETDHNTKLVSQVAALEIRCDKQDAKINKQNTEINNHKTDIDSLKRQNAKLKGQYEEVQPRVAQLEGIVQQTTGMKLNGQGIGNKDHSPQDEKLQKTWRHVHTFAIKHMNVSVRHQLFGGNLIEAREMHEVKRRLENKGPEDACEYMLEVLTRSVHSAETFQLFLTALENDKQKQLMKKYESVYNSLE